jgi:hypothetical protein
MDLTVKQAIGTREFAILMFITLMGSGYGCFLMINYKNYAASEIKDDHLLAMIGFVANFFNAVSRIFGTTLLDYMDFKTTWNTYSIFQLASCAGVAFGLFNKYFFAAAVCLGFVTQAFCVPATAYAASKSFGPVTGATVYAITTFGYALSSTLPVLYQFTILAYGGYTWVWLLLGVMTAASCVAVLFLNSERVQNKGELDVVLVGK